MSQRGEYVKQYRQGKEREETFEGSFTLLRESEKAMLLWDGTGKTDDAKWVPKSQIRSVSKTEKRDVINVLMSEWIAKEKGFA